MSPALTEPTEAVQHKRALCIGNTEYGGTSYLRFAHLDARQFALFLRNKANFDPSHVANTTNTARDDMSRHLGAFISGFTGLPPAAASTSAETDCSLHSLGVFHYAGHAVSYDGGMILLGVNWAGGDICKGLCWDTYGIELNKYILEFGEKFANHSIGLVVILDACRTPTSIKAAPPPLVGHPYLLTVHSCSPHGQADDNNSYTKTLLEVLEHQDNQGKSIAAAFSEANKKHWERSNIAPEMGCLDWRPYLTLCLVPKPNVPKPKPPRFAWARGLVSAA